ncbi:hypothetical protein [Christiangramia echinicola]|uniref:hypothetical protein n=1 Tax=Christiangramia echinicola TaxID=279359 RepID=UPI00047913E1|nr:hypothetical protein [Christiangramia echinicola]
MTLSAFGLLYLIIKYPDVNLILPSLYLTFVIYFWLTEFRTRAHRIEILNDKILKREYFGLGKEKIYKIKDVDGFYYSSQPNTYGDFEYRDYEYIFIIQKGKRIACLSKFYLRNYKTIKPIIEKKIKNLGTKEYKFRNEYKEMFK